jgi:hypothetical protein
MSENNWMTGLDEYFKSTDFPEYDEWQELYKAIYHNNWWHKRHVINKLYEQYNKESDVENLESVKESHLNIILGEKLESLPVKSQVLVGLIDYYFGHNNDLISRISRFLNYWQQDDVDDSVVVPDLNDFLSRGQIKSKMWLITELILGTGNARLDNVIFYGGWYNFLAYDFFQQLDLHKIYSLDVNADVISPSKRLCYQETKDERFLPKAVNVDKIVWAGSTMRVPVDQADDDCSEYWDLTENASLVVNTSCEHMDNTWYNNIPKGTLVALQTNDYFDNEQHTNCCKDLRDAKSKYPMSSIMYSGELETFLYNRFMLIGIK